jgi:hypothetical protein
MSLKLFLFIFSFLITNSFQTSEIRIISPKNLDLQLKSLPIDMEFSSFGKNPSNFHVRGQIYLANDENSTACGSLNMSLIKDEENEEKTDKFPILLIRRGGCSFTTKVRNAQNVGASMVFIADNKHENIHSIIMADDGTGNDIVIPSAMINYEDGNIIINYMKENKNELIIVDANFGVIETENEKNIKNVTFEFFFSSSEIRAYEFLKNISEYLSDFGSQILFIPHYVTHRSPFYDKSNTNPIENCVSFGKIDLSCSENVQNVLSIPIKDIQKCYNDSFIGEEKEKNNDDYEIVLKNSIFDSEYELRKKNFITKSPSITINDRLYLGRFKADSIFDSLCSSLIQKPIICYMEKNFNKKIEGVSLGSFLSIILVILFINIILFLICRTVIKKGVELEVDFSNINTKIDNMVGSYLNLRDSAPSEE